MKRPQKLQQFGVRLRELPKKYYIFSTLGFGALLYGVTFFIPKPVEFSYGGETCVSQLTFLPELHRAASTSKFQVKFEGITKVGPIELTSTKTCFSPTAAPKQGKVAIATAPWGGFVARKHFTVEVGTQPTANVALLDKPVPVSKPLTLDLDKPDATFQYKLKIGKKIVSCRPKATSQVCDINDLALKQGVSYDYNLARYFKNSGETALRQGTLKTLKAVVIKSASVKDNQTIYAKPMTFSFTMDKTLAEASVTLATAGKKPHDIAVKTEVKGRKLIVKLSKQLARETKYRLVIKQAEAVDGSTLVEPEKRTFTMSGGPKVTGVNIGNSQVGTSAVVTVQFDQKLSRSVDIAKYVSFSGGKAVVGKNSSSVSVALQNLPLCKPFTIGIKKGLPSKYGIKSRGGWSLNSRTVCHSVYTYGASVQGRPLVAYIFGSSGSVTMYVGAIHGNESSSSGLMRAWIDELEAHPDRFNGKRIVVVPTINPDGVAMNTRTNARGVNLNRNFPTDNWQKDIDDTDGKHKGGGGKSPLSEPEAKALAALTRQYSPRLLLSFHAVGSLVQGDPGSPSASYAAKYASMVGYSNATGQGDTFDYGITGGYEDWAWRNQGVPSMVVELSSYTAYYIEYHRSALWAML